MTLLAPGALWWLLTALPVAAIFLYRRRIIEVEVPALAFWEQTRRRDTLGRWGRRLRRWLSLLVQLLIVLALVAALTEPVNPAHRSELLVVLDDSATMQTIEQDGQTRFGLARQIVLERLRDKPSGARATVILAGMPPKIAVDREMVSQRARTALSERQPRDVNPQIDAALMLAERKRQDDASTILVISDRCEAQLAERDDVEWLRVGEPHPNLAIEALASGAAGTTVEALLTHRGMAATTATVSLFANQQEQVRRTVSLREGATVVQLDPALAPGTLFQVRVEPLDAFPLDNTASGVWPAPAHVRLQLVTAGNLFLEAALDQPGASLRVFSPEEWSRNETPDVTILDSPDLTGSEPTPGRFIIFGGRDPFGITRAALPATDLTPTQWSVDSPLVRDIDLLRWHIDRTAGLMPPDFAQRVVQCDDVSLIFVVQDPGMPEDARDDFVAIYVNFELQQSNITRRAGFPVFLWNAIDFLLDRRPEDALVSYATGVPLTFPPRPRPDARVIDPIGHEIQAFFDDSRMIVPFPEQAGFYRLDAGGPAVVRAVNYVSDGVRTAERLDDEALVGSPMRRPNWLASLPPWGVLVAAASALLLIEMLLFHRGMLRVD